MQIPSNRRRLGLFVTAMAALGALPGCAMHNDEDHTSEDAPKARDPERSAPVWPQRIRTLVLSSGGPRGYVHIGVLKALDELKLRPDLVVGASVGALVGALYADGSSALAIEQLAHGLSPLALARLSIGSPERLDSTPLAQWLRVQLSTPYLERLATPFAPVAIERASRRPVAFVAGDVGLAVRASSAIEGLYTPVRIRGTPYIDADLACPLPVRVARRLGGVRVLAIDASAHEDRAPAGAERFREGDLRKRATIAPDAAAADVYLHPDFGYWVSASREFRERAIEAGYRDTLAAAPALRARWA